MPVASATPSGPAAARASSSAWRGSRTVRAGGPPSWPHSDCSVPGGSARGLALAVQMTSSHSGSSSRSMPAASLSSRIEMQATRRRPSRKPRSASASAAMPARVVGAVEDGVRLRCRRPRSGPGRASRPPRRPRRPRPARRGRPRRRRARPRSCAAGRGRGPAPRGWAGSSPSSATTRRAPRSAHVRSRQRQRVGVQVVAHHQDRRPAARRRASRARCRPRWAPASACAPGRRWSAPARARG